MTSLRACSRLLSPLRAGPAAAQFRRTFSTAGAIRSHTRSVPLQHCYRVRYSINSQPSSLSTFSSRSFATSPSRTPQGDQLVAELEELYGTARDEVCAPSILALFPYTFLQLNMLTFLSTTSSFSVRDRGRRDAGKHRLRRIRPGSCPGSVRRPKETVRSCDRSGEPGERTGTGRIGSDTTCPPERRRRGAESDRPPDPGAGECGGES